MKSCGEDSKSVGHSGGPSQIQINRPCRETGDRAVSGDTVVVKAQTYRKLMTVSKCVLWCAVAFDIFCSKSTSPEEFVISFSFSYKFSRFL